MTTTGGTSTSKTNGSGARASAAAPRLERRDDGFLHHRVDVGEVTLHVAEARPANVADDAAVPDDVPLVVFLHGFPEFYYSWRHQLTALSEAGFWAVAPDMRGYNESEKPDGIPHYEVEKLAGDIAGLVRALGRKKAIVVGHDWGAVVAWVVAQLHADIVSRLAILNVPHPLEMQRGLRRPKQLKKSWYMFFFQLPFFPERLIAATDYEYIRRMFSSDGFPPDEIERYVDALRVPGAVRSAVSYYRAAIRRVFKASVPKTQVIDVPVLVIWGDQDKYLGKEMAAPPARFVPNARVVHIPEATHWVQNAAPAKVNELLIEFARGT